MISNWKFGYKCAPVIAKSVVSRYHTVGKQAVRKLSAVVKLAVVTALSVCWTSGNILGPAPVVPLSHYERLGTDIDETVL